MGGGRAARGWGAGRWRQAVWEAAATSASSGWVSILAKTPCRATSPGRFRLLRDGGRLQMITEARLARKLGCVLCDTSAWGHTPHCCPCLQLLIWNRFVISSKSRCGSLFVRGYAAKRDEDDGHYDDNETISLDFFVSLGCETANHDAWFWVIFGACNLERPSYQRKSSVADCGCAQPSAPKTTPFDRSCTAWCERNRA